MKYQLPRIRYANQELDIAVNKTVLKNSKDAPKAQMALEFSKISVCLCTRVQSMLTTIIEDGTAKIMDISSNRSSEGILDELMEVATGERWRNAKAAV